MPFRHFLLALTLLTPACGGDVASTRSALAQEFVIEVQGERFRVRSSDPTTLALADCLRTAREGWAPSRPGGRRERPKPSRAGHALR